MTIEEEDKVIGSLAEIGVTFPVEIIYPTGRKVHVSRVKKKWVTPKLITYTDNVIQFPTPDDCA